MNTIQRALYKAKRIDNGEWAEFSLFDSVIQDSTNENQFFLYRKNAGTYDKSTISQFTGLTDSKGNKIFEGDIVYVPEKNGFKGVVKWDCEVFGFYVSHGENRWGDSCLGDEFELIGNIFDNPELIGGE